MNQISITGIGSYLPALAHSNETLPPLDHPLDDQRRARIGVERRYWAGPEESIPAMAAAAARKALDDARCAPDQVDLIILSNWTGRCYLPDLAPEIKALLGADRAFAFDLGTACTGFLLALATAKALLGRGDMSKALVIAAETTSQRARPGSNATLVYSDGAGAFVLERDRKRGGRLIDVVMHTDTDARSIMDIDKNTHVRMHIPQRELIALAADSLASAAQEILARNDLSPSQIDWFLPHSGTAAIQAALRAKNVVPADRILTNFEQVGNLSSASIPVALDHFLRSGSVRRGDLVLSAAVGSGWYRAGALYQV